MQREAAHDRNDRWASLSLTAEFHILVAELAGNAVLLEIARELMLRTSLAIATFEVPGSPDCSPDAHPGICQFILARNKPTAQHRGLPPRHRFHIAGPSGGSTSGIMLR